MADKKERELIDKIEECEKVIRLMEDAEEEMNYQDRITQDIFQDMLSRYQKDAEFHGKVLALQQSVWEAKVCKDTKMSEMAQELRDSLRKLKREEESYQEGQVWD